MNRNEIKMYNYRTFLFLFSSLMTSKHMQMFKIFIFYSGLINKLSDTDNNN